METKAKKYAIAHLANPHRQQVEQYKKELIDKITHAVKDRLTKEINYWDHRAVDLRRQEQAGKPNAKINLYRQILSMSHIRVFNRNAPIDAGFFNP